MDDKPISKAKPCKICSGFGEMFEKTKGTAGGGGSKAKAADANAGSQNGAGPATSTMADKYGCPENVQTVGRAGWSVLHSMAATYPDAPSPVDQSDISSFISVSLIAQARPVCNRTCAFSLDCCPGVSASNCINCLVNFAPVLTRVETCPA